MAINIGYEIICLTHKQIRRLRFTNGPNGQPSGQERDIIAILNAALNMRMLEPGRADESKRKSLHMHEIEAAAKATGIKTSTKLLFRVKYASATLILEGGFRRTEQADAVALAFMAAGEDIEPSKDDPRDLRPLDGVIADQDILDELADKIENMLIDDAERLNVLDAHRACRRIARQIARMCGLRSSVPVRYAFPRACCPNSLSKRYPHLADKSVGTPALERAADILRERMQNDPHHSSPMERFWQIARTVLVALGATVTMDVEAYFAPEKTPCSYCIAGQELEAVGLQCEPHDCDEMRNGCEPTNSAAADDSLPF